MIKKIDLNYNWYYIADFKPSYIEAHMDDVGFEVVHLPHTNIELPLNNFSEESYQFESFYKKEFYVEPLLDEHVYMRFEGVMTYAEIYVNGHYIGEHKGGYTPFEFDITPYVHEDAFNMLSVYVDSRERDDIPPFGHVMDFLTYGGIYREVALIYKNVCHIKDLLIKPEDVLTKPKLNMSFDLLNLSQEDKKVTLECHLYNKNKQVFSCSRSESLQDTKNINWIEEVGNIQLWSVDAPNLYEVVICVLEDNQVIDKNKVRIGFRQFEFRRDGFYLNNEKHKIVGLNRQQSFPYVGYAMPKSAQYKDADILKHALKVNTVRLSHYPQSNHFLDRCDEIGLLVFEEIPGWQHIGNEGWQEVALQNIEEMIKRDWNRPSVFMWGTRINESNDDHDFYKKTSEKARELDDSRAIGGVRCIKNSELLEDVYTYNDFSHTGNNPGLEAPNKVFKEKKPYLITEYNGHMYPTKKYDDEAHRVSHAHRHMRVLDALYGDDHITGAIGWCMFDYNTHKDFGSGDKICYHGVMDMFRIPKMAAYAYASQQRKEPILHVGSSMNIGEHKSGFLTEINVFTNCDWVNFYRNDAFIKRFYPNRHRYGHLPSPPICIDDFIGECLEKVLFSSIDGKLVKKLLMKANKSRGNLRIMDKLKLGYILLKYKMTTLDMENLYTKYYGGWGGKAAVYRIDGFINNQMVKSVTKGYIFAPTLKVELDSTVLCEEATYDVTRVVVSLRDEYDHPITYANDAFQVITSEHITVIGPDILGLIGGSMGFWIKTTGTYGDGFIEVVSPRFGRFKKRIQVKDLRSLNIDENIR